MERSVKFYKDIGDFVGLYREQRKNNGNVQRQTLQVCHLDSGSEDWRIIKLPERGDREPSSTAVVAAGWSDSKLGPGEMQTGIASQFLYTQHISSACQVKL